jgi:hypothetical protein
VEDGKVRHGFARTSYFVFRHTQYNVCDILLRSLRRRFCTVYGAVDQHARSRSYGVQCPAAAGRMCRRSCPVVARPRYSQEKDVRFDEHTLPGPSPPGLATYFEALAQEQSPPSPVLRGDSSPVGTRQRRRKRQRLYPSRCLLAQPDTQPIEHGEDVAHPKASTLHEPIILPSHPVPS